MDKEIKKEMPVENENVSEVKKANPCENNGKKCGKKKNSTDLTKLIEENELLKKQLEESNNKADEVKQSWVRCAADFENFKKRNSESRANAYRDGKGDAIKSILLIGDNLDRALATIKDESTKEGIELIIKQYSEIMKNMGVEEINPVGEIFDPNIHEAVHQVEPEEGDVSGNIKAVFRKGYSLDGKMLRYAQVVVIK